MLRFRYPPWRLPKAPTVNRCLVIACLAVLVGTVGTAFAEPPIGRALTEQEAVELALGRAPLADVLAGSVVAEEGRARVVSVRPNPELSYSREQTFGASGTSEQYAIVSQSIDLGGRRGLRADAAEHRVQAIRLEGNATRIEIALETRLRFYEVLYQRQRVVALETWHDHVGKALSIIVGREQRGDVARYDRRRLERELSVSLGRLATTSALFARARARLQATIGKDMSADEIVTGTLLPPDDPVAGATLRLQAASRPDLLAVDQRVMASASEAAAASRWWAPDLKLEGGLKLVSLGSNGRTDGYVFGAALAFPLWDRSGGLARVAQGEARSARGRGALLKLELDGELDGARGEAAMLRAGAIALREQTAAASGDLVRIASVGYEAGELSILELLDAYRGAVDDELAVIDMEFAARRTRLELDRLTGAGLR